MKHKVGIFAGTFDPIHEGHILMAEQAIKECGLDKVFFLIEPRPRHKQGVKAFEHRLHMVQLAIREHKKLGSIVLEQPRFTVNETLPVLQSRFKGAQLFLIMGDDVASHLSAWPHIEDLAKSMELIVALRKQSVTQTEKHLEAMKKIKGLSIHYNILYSNMSSESSSHVRAILRRGEVPLTLHPRVYAYIKEQGLYTSAETSA